MAFFPNYLKRRYQLKKQAEMRTPFNEDCIPSVKEILATYRKEDLWDPHLFLSEYDLNTQNNIDDRIYEICRNKKLHDTLWWISKKMLTTIGVDNYLTVGVYMRIGTSMINKLIDDNIISKDFGIYYHDNFVRNATDLISYTLEEDLPF